MAEDLTQRFRGLVRGCPRSGAAAPPPPPPPPPSAQLRRAALVVRGIRRCERTLRRVAVAYATPGPGGGGLGDDQRDGVDARVAAVLAECRAALAAAPRGAAAAPREGSRAAHDRGGAELQLERERLATEFEGSLDAARRVEAKMEHVSRLTSAFSSLVSEQAETVANLYDLVEETAASVDKSGDQLARAAARASSFPRFFNCVVLGAAAGLLLLNALLP
ncbi:expressed protein [Aureococcus anophagefferens]|uniref:Expressed protein n=1 Tax=Aureococcus anophagefferens TaxID=44056 RepID=F0XX09_AURAN|nr:expressed protein [Aureococcus anophagefferens]EGB12868.1 expressed protein [Aureococcus anophagefferens]|eukprot:XP_009032498.1 expressed protein [Aureococcus anophagefferens]